jgi:hypothetical protein
MKTIKLLEESIVETLQDIRIGNNFFGHDPKRVRIKAKLNKWDYVKLKSFCTAKQTIDRVKRKPAEWEKIFTKYTSGRMLMYTLYKKIKQLKKIETI